MLLDHSARKARQEAAAHDDFLLNNVPDMLHHRSLLRLSM